MTALISVREAVDRLSRDPLRNIVLLKQLLAYPERARVHRACSPEGVATLVALDAAISPYDRQTYPMAAVVAFIESECPTLTRSLLSHVPNGVGIVFRLSRDADLPAIAAGFPVSRRTAFVSFTGPGGAERERGVRIAAAPGEGAYRLWQPQGHDPNWLEPLLGNGKAFASVLEGDDETQSACFAFENFGPVWEVGGVVTAPAHRQRGLGARTVRAALAELARRGLAARYQVEEQNLASIRLAHSVGLVPFLTIVHYAHAC